MKPELKVGHRTAPDGREQCTPFNFKSHRDQERLWVEQAETAYASLCCRLNPRGPKGRTGAAKEERLELELTRLGGHLCT